MSNSYAESTVNSKKESTLKSIIVSLVLLFSMQLCANETILAENAPKDKPVSAASDTELDTYHKAQEPYIDKARKSYPQAKERYLKGLPSGEHFFLTTRLYDDQGREEQVFILVKNIADGVIEGIIFNKISTVSGYKNRQEYSFPEKEIYDWLITKPNGGEEGNFVGKFIDTYHH